MQHHLDAGDDVIGVDDLSNEHSHFLKGYRNIRMDLAEFLADAGDYDLVYHFAAPVGGRLKIEGDPLFNADSLRLDSVLFRWAIRHTSTVVYPSSSAVYGVSLQGESGPVPLQEGMFHAANPSWLAPDEMYGFTKLVGERLAYAAEAYGLNTLCLRPFSGYGEGQSFEYPVPSIAARAKRREDPLVVWGSGAQRRDFIHVSDLVHGTVARLAHGINGYQTLNLGTGWSMSFLEIARVCAEIVGYAPAIVTDESKPVGVFDRRASIDRMYRYYEPRVMIRDGLRRVIEWLP